MSQLALYVNDSLPSSREIKNWGDFFQLLASYTIYLEELQWLANYEKNIISHLEYVWDNYFQRNPDLIILLWGSSPSFMLDKVVNSQALYNRSQYEFSLKEFLKGRSNREVFNTYLTVGGFQNI